MGPHHPPTIEGYYFSDAAVHDIGRHNRQVAHARDCPLRSLRVGMVFLSVPSRCNLRCPYCYTDSGSARDNETLSTTEVEHVISVSAQLGAKSVVVAGDGEPFMSSSVWDIIESASRHRMTCVVFTNGSLLTREIARQLYAKPVSVIVKVNSFQPSTQDALLGVKGAHRDVYAGLDALLSEGFRAPRLALQSAIMKPNINDLGDIFVFCRTVNIVPYIETYVAVGRGARESVRRALEPSVDQVEDFFAKMQKIDRDVFNIQWPAAHRGRVVAYGPCNKNRVALTVRLNGDVCRCITESRKLGNIRTSSFEDVVSVRGTARELARAECVGCCACHARH